MILALLALLACPTDSSPSKRDERFCTERCRAAGATLMVTNPLVQGSTLPKVSTQVGAAGAIYCTCYFPEENQP